MPMTRYADMAGRHVGSRHVDVWWPDGAAGQRLPVIYMHDGQNLFDPATSYGGEPWAIDAALRRVMRRSGLPGAIVVGIWNTPLRWREYAPQGPMAALRGTPLWASYLERAGGEPIADAYLDFIVSELKPRIDAEHPTRPEREQTFLMGSSMGGLISLYGLCRHPQVFAGAGCVSTHWPAGGAGLVDGLAALLPAPGGHRLYYDYGTLGLDADYGPLQRRMDRHMRRLGYARGPAWQTRRFAGADHSEPSWRLRAHLPLGFLLRP